MKYKTQNNETVAAGSATELVAKLRQISLWDSGCTDEAFMANVSRRIAIEKGVVVSYKTAEAFVQGLIDCGVLVAIA